MNNSVIVSGEASETDSEDETPKKLNAHVCKPIQGAVITGEDSESENENDASVASAVSALNELNTFDNGNQNEIADKYDSLLHLKLKECNGKLHQDIESFCTSTVGEANKKLGFIDQNIIKSQLTLQSAVTSLKSLGANSLAIKNRLHSLISAQFIPNVVKK